MMQKVVRRSRQSWRILRTDGATALTRRVVRAAATSVGADRPELPLLWEDVADSGNLPVIPAAPSRGERPLTIAWVTQPPSKGSGGHTTMFRFIEALEREGHTCILYVYDRFGGDVQAHAEVVRSWWPNVRAEVRDAQQGIPEHDAYVATSWPTAHVLASRATEPGERFYLVQTFEPYFFARGSEYALAEDTYRFGFHCITVGHMAANELRDVIGVEAVVAEFGCDADVYSLTNARPRRDVIFYMKPDTPQRGYLLGALALDLFHARHPEVVIHTFDAPATGLPFPVEEHSRMTPLELNALYNRCAAGIALSFTNISLVANEMLAAGTIPIVNDSPLARADLDNPHVAWARPTPHALAQALCDIVEADDDGGRAVEVARSVEKMTWSSAQQTVVDTIERRCWQRS